MTCTFFGHRDAPECLLLDLESAILDLIHQKEEMRFYVGNNGRFDFLAQKALERIYRIKKEIEYSVVLSFLDERPMVERQGGTLFPEILAVAPPPYATYKRNEWLINHSDFVIAYARYQTSNSYKWIQKAEKKGLQVINLAD